MNRIVLRTATALGLAGTLLLTAASAAEAGTNPPPTAGAAAVTTVHLPRNPCGLLHDDEIADLRVGKISPHVSSTSWGRQCQFGRYIGVISTGTGNAAKIYYTSLQANHLHTVCIRGVKAYWFGSSGYNVFTRIHGVVVFLQGNALRLTKRVFGRILYRAGLLS